MSHGKSKGKFVYPLSYSAILEAEIADAWAAEHKLRLDLVRVVNEVIKEISEKLAYILESKGAFPAPRDRYVRTTCEVKRDSLLLFEKTGERISLNCVIAAHRVVEAEGEVPLTEGELLQLYRAHIAVDLVIALIQTTLSALSVARRRFVLGYREAEGTLQEITECRIEPV